MERPGIVGVARPRLKGDCIARQGGEMMPIQPADHVLVWFQSNRLVSGRLGLVGSVFGVSISLDVPRANNENVPLARYCSLCCQSGIKIIRRNTNGGPRVQLDMLVLFEVTDLELLVSRWLLARCVGHKHPMKGLSYHIDQDSSAYDSTSFAPI